MISGARLGVAEICMYISLLPINLSPGGSGNAGGPLELVFTGDSLPVFASLSLFKKVTLALGCYVIAEDEKIGYKDNTSDVCLLSFFIEPCLFGAPY